MGIAAGTMAQGSLALQGAGAASAAVGAYYGAKSQQIAARGAAAIGDINAQQSELAAQQELFRGNAEVAAATQRAGQVKGAQRTALAANGVDLGVGSAAEVLTSTDIAKENDINTITANAVRSAWGYRTQATNFQNDALAKRASADSISPGMAAFTSLLGSAGQVASSWYVLNKAGAMPTTKGA
jgi:hypothetical protein